MDREVVEAVVVAKEGRVGACIDICLEMSSGFHTPIEQPSPPRRESQDNPSRRSSGQNGQEDKADTTIDLLGLDEEDGVAGIDLEDRGHGDRPGKGGHVDLMS